jgi:hypothetical protein
MDANASFANSEHVYVMQARGVHAYGAHAYVMRAYTLHIHVVYC